MKNIEQNKLAKVISENILKKAYNTLDVLNEMEQEGIEYVYPEELYVRKCINAILHNILNGYIVKRKDEIYPLINKELNTLKEKLQKDNNELTKFKNYLQTTYKDILKKRFNKKDIIDINNSKDVESMTQNAMYLYSKGANNTWAKKKNKIQRKAAYPFYEMVKDNTFMELPNDPIGVKSDIEKKSISVDLSNVDLQKDFVNAGYFNKYGLDNIDEKELAMGIEIEKEHTTNPEVAKRIALDHLTEISNYYTLLKEMEDKAKKENKSE